MAATTEAGTGPATEAPPTVFALNPTKAVTDLYYCTTTKDAKLCAGATSAPTTRHDGTRATLLITLYELRMQAIEIELGNAAPHQRHCFLPPATAWSPLATSPQPPRRSTINPRAWYKKIHNDGDLYPSLLSCMGSQALCDLRYSYFQGSTPCAPLLMKVILLDCEVKNASTNFILSERRTQLDESIKTLEYNVLTFNKHVQDLQRKLKQDSEEFSGLLMHVMRAYFQCKWIGNSSKTFRSESSNVATCRLSSRHL
jgi:hypothetical protein